MYALLSLNSIEYSIFRNNFLQGENSLKRLVNVLVVMTLAFGLVGASFAPSAGAAGNSTVTENTSDLYLNQESETVLLDGVSYTYDYGYEGGNKTITITNTATNSVEKVAYDEDNSVIYYNDEELTVVEDEDNAELSGVATYATNTWVTVSTSSKYVSWAKGISAAALAAVIAVPLSGLGVAGVIAAMGMGALGVLAAGAIGGTVKLKLQRFTPSFGAPYHRYLWSFKASTGDSYGDYIYHI